MSGKLTGMDARELILELHKRDGVPGLAKLPGLWERKLDDEWTIWVNGQLTPLPAGALDGAKMHVRPGDCYVEYNGWPAGNFSLITGEGIIAVGGGANYQTFCDALRQAIAASTALSNSSTTRPSDGPSKKDNS